MFFSSHTSYSNKFISRSIFIEIVFSVAPGNLIVNTPTTLKFYRVNNYLSFTIQFIEFICSELD